MNKKILVVDDDPAMVQTLSDVLELQGWQTVRAFGGEGVADLAEDPEVSLVLMDVRMPHVNGVDALRFIKARRPGLRVILMTAYTAESLLAEAERCGAYRILRKPLDVGELLGLLERIVGEAWTVLVIDESPDHLTTVCDALDQRGAKTIRATSIDQALRHLERRAPEAVLLHLRLLGVDPLDALLKIRDANDLVLVVLYSGSPEDLVSTLELVPRSLVDAAFLKPLPLDQVIGLLHDPKR
jgi:DNA-binding NtrC family response regulator